MEVNSYVTLVLHGMQEDLGRCGPLSNVYKSVLVAGCNRVIDPFVRTINFRFNDNFNPDDFFRMDFGLASFGVRYFSCQP